MSVETTSVQPATRQSRSQRRTSARSVGQTLDILESLHEIAPVSRIGSLAPVHCVATGRAILAYIPREELDALIEHGLERHTEATITDRELLLAELEGTRRRGYALNRGAWRA